MDIEQIELPEPLEIALLGGVLFEQYDEQTLAVEAANDSYENLYPHVA